MHTCYQHFINITNCRLVWCINSNGDKFGSPCCCLFLTVLKVIFLDVTLDPNEGTKLDHFVSEPTMLILFILLSLSRVYHKYFQGPNTLSYFNISWFFQIAYFFICHVISTPMYKSMRPTHFHGVWGVKIIYLPPDSNYTWLSSTTWHIIAIQPFRHQPNQSFSLNK